VCVPAERPINFEIEFETKIENGPLDWNRNFPSVEIHFTLEV
jgi:hypothetical protein